MKGKANRILFQFIHTAFSIMIALGVLYVAAVSSGKAYTFGYRVFTEPAVDEEPGKDITITVSDGMTASELGELLESKGLIDSAGLFTAQLNLSIYSMQESAKKKQILPGTYTLNSSMTAKEMMSLMATVPETDTENAAESTEAASAPAVEEITVSSEE